MVDLSETVESNSDHLTADDLIGGPRRILITAVSGSSDKARPIVIRFEGDDGKPFLPCKTVRRLLIAAWGKDGAAYVGRELMLVRDPEVMYSGIAVGGIRISHMTHLDGDLVVVLAKSRGKKAKHTIRQLAARPAPEPAPEPPTAEQLAQALGAINGATADSLEPVLVSLRAHQWTPEQTLEIKAAIQEVKG